MAQKYEDVRSTAIAEDREYPSAQIRASSINVQRCVSSKAKISDFGRISVTIFSLRTLATKILQSCDSEEMVKIKQEFQIVINNVKRRERGIFHCYKTLMLLGRCYFSQHLPGVAPTSVTDIACIKDPFLPIHGK